MNHRVASPAKGSKVIQYIIILIVVKMMDNYPTIAKLIRFSTMNTSKTISYQDGFFQSAKTVFTPPGFSLRSSLLGHMKRLEAKRFPMSDSISRLPNLVKLRIIHSGFGSTKAGVLFLVNGFTYLAKAVIASGFDYISASFAGFKHTIIIPLKGRYG